jgi:hypothetical protein
MLICEEAIAHNVSPNNAGPPTTLFYQQRAGLSDLYLSFTESHHRHNNEGASLLGVLCAVVTLFARLFPDLINQLKAVAGNIDCGTLLLQFVYKPPSLREFRSEENANRLRRHSG